MAHELWLVKGETMTNITPLVGSISWSSNVDELGMQLSFDIAYNDDRFHPVNPCEIGDMVILRNGGYEITRTIIVDESKGGRSPVSYTAFDFAFYLNKSTAIYQFNGASANEAITKICNDFNIPTGIITTTPISINKIYNGETVSDILYDIVQQVEWNQQHDYLFEMREGKLFVERAVDTTITGTFQHAGDLSEHDVTSAVSSPSMNRSMSDMINSIKVVQNEEVVLTQQKEQLVDDYGLLQSVIELDEDSGQTAEEVANAELAKLAKITRDYSINLLGDDRVRAGRFFKLVEPVTGIDGEFLISDCSHTVSGGIHTMSLSLTNGVI